MPRPTISAARRRIRHRALPRGTRPFRHRGHRRHRYGGRRARRLHLPGLQSLSLDPPLVVLAPGKTSTSWPRIASAGRSASTSWPRTKRLSPATSPSRAATSSPAWAGSRRANGAPVLDGALAWVECELRAGARRRRPRARGRAGEDMGVTPWSAARLLPGRLRALGAHSPPGPPPPIEEIGGRR